MTILIGISVHLLIVLKNLNKLIPKYNLQKFMIFSNSILSRDSDSVKKEPKKISMLAEITKGKKKF